MARGRHRLSTAGRARQPKSLQEREDTMNALAQLFARTAPALLVLLLGTQGALSQAAGPQQAAPQDSAVADAVAKVPSKADHRLVLQVASNEPGIMNLAL